MRTSQPTRTRPSALMVLGEGSERAAATLLPGTVLPGLAQLGGLILIAQLGGERLLGSVSLAWVTATFGAQVIALGPAHAAVRAVSTGESGVVPAYRRFLLRRLARAVPGLCFLGLALHGAGSELGLPILYGAAWLAGQAVILFEVEVLKSEHRFARHSAVVSVRAVASWGASAAGVALVGGLAAAMLPHLVISGAVAAWLAGSFRATHDLSSEELGSIVGPVSRLAIANYALGYADRYAVALILGPAAVGVYTLAYRIAEGCLEIVVAPVVQALLPRTIAEWNNSGKGPRVAEATVRRGAALLLVATALLVPLVPLADTWGILHWVSGHRDFALVVVLAAVGIGLNGVVRLVYGLMLAQGRAGAAMRAFWIVLAFAAVLVPALTHLYGIAGTAAASLAVYLALMVVTARSALTDRRQVDRAASRNGPGRTHDAVVALGVTEFFPASGAGEITGGVEARAFYLARYFGPERLRVIASRTDGSRWEYASLGSVPRRLWFMATAFARGLRQRFDVVEGSNLVTHPVAWLLGVVRRRPVVFFYPDVVVDVERIDGSRTTRSLETLLERLVLRLPASRYIAPSEAVARKLALRGVAVDRIRVIPCGVDGPLVERLAPPGRTRTMAHDLAVIGRLVPYKRVDLVLEAVAELSKTFPDLSVVVVGQGPEVAHLASEARRLGIADRVDFRGFVTEHEEVLRVLATSRVFVSASEAEGFGIVLAEAMALGVPYVVADIPAFREVSGEGHGGYLFAPGDRHDLARGLEEIFGARPDEYDRMSRAACGFARGRYTWEAVAQATADVYDELTRNRRIGDKGVRDG